MAIDNAKLKRSARRTFRNISRGKSALVLSIIAFGIVLSVVGYIMVTKTDIAFGINSIIGYVITTGILVVGLFFGAMALMTFYRKVQPTWRKPNRYCLDLLLPPEAAEHRIAALQEAYKEWKTIHKLRKARSLYFWQSLGTIFHYWLERLLKKTKFIHLIDVLASRLK